MIRSMEEFTVGVLGSCARRSASFTRVKKRGKSSWSAAPACSFLNRELVFLNRQRMSRPVKIRYKPDLK